jgi:hypothetical protein
MEKAHELRGASPRSLGLGAEQLDDPQVVVVPNFVPTTKPYRVLRVYCDCAHWRRHQIVCGCCWHHLVGSTVELFRSFALHLQFLLGNTF